MTFKTAYKPLTLEVMTLRRRTGIILALDVEYDVNALLKIIMNVADLIDGVKLGWFQLFTIGPVGVAELIRNARVYSILDVKLADVCHVNKYVVEKAVRLGFGGIIAHAIIGRENLRCLIEKAQKEGLDVFLLTAMTMGGELYDMNVDYVVKLGLELGVTGFVAPATKPGILRRVRELAGNKPILTPGIGAQGGDPELAGENGADFIIVGRAVLQAEDSRDVLSRLIKAFERGLKKRYI